LDEIDLSDFVHGGVNITGFTLLDMTQPRVQAYQKEWMKPNMKYWHVANGYRKLRVIRNTLLPNVKRHLLASGTSLRDCQ
jgi:hypothetical protein